MKKPSSALTPLGFVVTLLETATPILVVLTSEEVISMKPHHTVRRA